jgi:UDP-N-acetylmuramoyl-tripeptide--D-alanyl-D-alanine ligase
MDAYNANPDSMRAAIENLALYSGKKAAILGDMNELENPEASHKEIVQLLLHSKIDHAVLIGKYFGQVKNTTSHYDFFENKDEALRVILKIYDHADVVLIKSSRSSKLESLLNQLE